MARVTYRNGWRRFIATFLPEFIEVTGPERVVDPLQCFEVFKEFFPMAGPSRFVVRASLTALACTFVALSLGAQQQQPTPAPAQPPAAPAGGRQSGQPREGQPPAGRGDQP